MMDNEFLFNSKIIIQNENKKSIIINNIGNFNGKERCFEEILKILGIDIDEKNWINNLLNKAFFVEGPADFYFLKILFKLNDNLRKYFNNILIIPMNGKDKLNEKNGFWKKFIESIKNHIILLDSNNDNKCKNYQDQDNEKIVFLNQLSNCCLSGPENLIEKTYEKYENDFKNKHSSTKPSHLDIWNDIYHDFYENKKNVFSEQDKKNLEEIANKMYFKIQEIYDKNSKK